jgi:hypothetical protein
MEGEKIDPSNHKIWGLHRTGHNAHFLGKLLLGLSASTIFNTISDSSTELSTEAVERNRTSASGGRNMKDMQNLSDLDTMHTSALPSKCGDNFFDSVGRYATYNSLREPLPDLIAR